MKFLRLFLSLVFIFNLPAANAVSTKPISFTAEIWADNWFALYVNGKKVGEDSVPITTQKSFNSETIKFTATYPITVGVIAKDYVQSKSGLEYLGTANQQIGDGGLILQIRETLSKKLVGVSDETWRTFVQNTAPLNPECEKSSTPDLECKFQNNVISTSWASTAFKDSTWLLASIFSADAVGPKDGFFNIQWHQSAKFIWGKDLKLDNVIYFRKKFLSASSTGLSSPMSISLPNSPDGKLLKDNTCDGKSLSPAINISNVPANAKSLILIMDTIPGPPRPGETQTGNHYYFYKFNILPNSTKFSEGSITPYSPPCSQGPGLKEYRFFVYALNYLLSSESKYDGATLYDLGEKQAIMKASKIYTYAR